MSETARGRAADGDYHGEPAPSRLGGSRLAHQLQAVDPDGRYWPVQRPEVVIMPCRLGIWIVIVFDHEVPVGADVAFGRRRADKRASKLLADLYPYHYPGGHHV